MATIQEINSSIITRGRQLATRTRTAITNLNIPAPTAATPPTRQSQSAPGRPWFLTGAVALTAGVIGFMATNGKWPYVVGALGLASLAIATTQNKQTTAQRRQQPTSAVNYVEIKDSITRQVGSLLDEARRQWDEMMSEAKSSAQAAIRNTTLNDEQKDALMSHTYYPESLDLSTLPLLDALNAIEENTSFTSCLMKAKAAFAATVEQKILQTIESQTTEFAKIQL